MALKPDDRYASARAPGRRPRALAGRRAGLGLSRADLDATDPLGPSPPHGGGRHRRAPGDRGARPDRRHAAAQPGQHPGRTAASPSRGVDADPVAAALHQQNQPRAALVGRRQHLRTQELLKECRPRSPGDLDLRGFEWHYLDRLCGAGYRSLKGHEGPVWSVAFSPDGSRLASGGDDSQADPLRCHTGRRARGPAGPHASDPLGGVQSRRLPSSGPPVLTIPSASGTPGPASPS